MNKLMKTMSNRTGGKMAPRELKKSIKGAELYSPLNEGDATSLNEIRSQYADPETLIGTAPPPASFKQGAAVLQKQLQGKDLTVLVDKLSERISFEATGTRLYESLIAKCVMAEALPNGMDLDELLHIRDEEHQHFLMLVNTVEELGGDPTVVSPSADAAATATMGLCKVIGDPRTTVMQALDAILIAELTDNDGWTMLIELCRQLQLPDIGRRFQKALKQEEEHLHKVRSWLHAAMAADAGAAMARTRSSASRTSAKKRAATTKGRAATAGRKKPPVQKKGGRAGKRSGTGRDAA